MKTVVKSVVGLAIWGACGCAVGTDGGAADSEGASLGKDSAASTLAGVTQGYRGDFDGDGIEDILVVQGSGTNEYLGLAGGGFSASKWFRPNSNTAYVVGDFNKDGFSDVIATDETGSLEYLGQSGGGFTPSGWVRPDLPRAGTAYHSGDFNGDGATDVIITTAFGSFEYLGVQNGTFRDGVWSQNWPFGQFSFAVGDFNNDTRSDLIVTNASGSFEFLGLIGGGFSQATWPAGINFLLNQSNFFVGDYNGDGSFDLVAQNSFAAMEIHGKAGVSGGFGDPIWTRTDLRTLEANFIPGDFNGDGKWDAVIATGLGAFLYIGQANNLGLGGDVWHDNTLPTYKTGFYAGNFSGTTAAQRKITDLIVTTASGSTEYLGRAGTNTGGFNVGTWSRPSMPFGGVVFY